jgi:hypothetical protein
MGDGVDALTIIVVCACCVLPLLTAVLGHRAAHSSEERSAEVIVMTEPKVNRRYLYLGAGLIAAIVACMVIALVWPGAKAAAVADRQRMERDWTTQELHLGCSLIAPFLPSPRHGLCESHRVNSH